MFSFCGMLLSIPVNSGDSEFYGSPNSLYQFREVEENSVVGGMIELTFH